ncbi:hypothetical protein MANY_48340 [Mycolicibacterium anyangense]|uniref:Uncharacterized protein n=1 Tax=Mycolicibacterium anyangense TaxID=1431246 RepID=A0A6N4WH43_9MYCO|nr:hypothetical protein [Mycolicibacterium anyangense]BBZ79497.1 hypothetical protein MANY_48340 [Mycolicibacterium anyangense]
MPDDTSDNLPAPADSEEVEVSVQPGGLVVSGEPEAVEAYLSRLRNVAGRTMQVTGINRSSIGNAAGLLAGMAGILADGGKYVRLHPDSVNALRVGNWIPGTDGYFRMMTRGHNGLFLQQLQWAPTPIAPPQMLAVQLIATQLALKSAIADVETAVDRVEGKVESVLNIAQATRAGDVLGNHLSIRRATDFLDKHGELPDADWDALAGLGPALNVTVEQLRNHVSRVLDSFEPNRPVQERAAKLRAAVEEKQLGETLSLLVVAEDALYRWQLLRLARIEEKEPQHRQRVIDDLNELIRHQLAEDGKLYREAKTLLDDFAKPAPIEGFRFQKVRELAEYRSTLRDELDRFATARRHQIEEWSNPDTPNVLDAAEAVIDAVADSALKVVGAAGQRLIRMGEYLAEKSPAKSPLPPGDESDNEESTSRDRDH